jgi:hypothetical protein
MILAQSEKGDAPFRERLLAHKIEINFYSLSVSDFLETFSRIHNYRAKARRTSVQTNQLLWDGPFCFIMLRLEPGLGCHGPDAPEGVPAQLYDPCRVKTQLPSDPGVSLRSTPGYYLAALRAASDLSQNVKLHSSSMSLSKLG